MSVHPALTQLAHRPWPIPPGEWLYRQAWCDLLFAHWPLDAKALRPLIPPALTIDEFEGSAWIGVVPFRMHDVARRPLPALPGLRAFPEVNLRTYVTIDGKPGVWFFSLDATNLVAVIAARRLFHVPYEWAEIRLHADAAGEGFHCVGTRRMSQQPVHFEMCYRPTGPVYQAQAGTLEHWLTERYCLYAESPRRELLRTNVQHAPWDLQPATAEVAATELFTPHGLSVEGSPTRLHFSRRIDVVAWSPERVATGGKTPR